MWLKIINLFTVYEIFSLIGQSNSAVYLTFGQKPVSEEYNRLKELNVYRGLFFSLTPEQKHEMCENMYSAQLFVNEFSQTDESLGENYFVRDQLRRKATQKSVHKLFVRDILAWGPLTPHEEAEFSLDDGPLTQEDQVFIQEDQLSINVGNFSIIDGQFSTQEGLVFVKEGKLLIKEGQLLIKKGQLSVKKVLPPEKRLVFKCIGDNFKKRNPNPTGWSSSYYLSSAFSPRWVYVSKTSHVHPEKSVYILSSLAALSPKSVALDPIEVEQRFMKTRRTLKLLSEESEEYIEQIKKRDNLSHLTRKQSLILCALILSSSAYRNDHLEYSVDWVEDTYKSSATLEYEKIEFSLRSTNNAEKDELSADCIPCKAFENGTEPDSKQTDLYLTQSYDHTSSVIVLKKEKDGIFIDKYFTDIALLIAMQDGMDYDKLFYNF